MRKTTIIKSLSVHTNRRTLHSSFWPRREIDVKRCRQARGCLSLFLLSAFLSHSHQFEIETDASTACTICHHPFGRYNISPGFNSTSKHIAEKKSGKRSEKLLSSFLGRKSAVTSETGRLEVFFSNPYKSHANILTPNKNRR